MANLLAIIVAKAVLLGLLAMWSRLPWRLATRVLMTGIAIGSFYGLVFFGLFYELVQAIDYHAPVTWSFVALNACLSYGVTAATVALFPFEFGRRRESETIWREVVYFSTTATVPLLVFANADSQFVKALCLGVILMSAAEAAALMLGYRGPIARMLYGAFGPMARLLAASAALGASYETLNLLFPVWEWTTLTPLPGAMRTALMMTVGYIVLVHPLFVTLRLVAPTALGRRSNGRETSTRDDNRAC